MSNVNALLEMRDAAEADLLALTALKQPEALHRDRLRDAQGSGFRYMVFLHEQEVIGFACLVFCRPASWSDANDTQHLPQVVDLLIAEAQRGRGYGSAFLRALEQEAAKAGQRELYIAAEPTHNARAYALYLRLGYLPLQAEPYRSVWAFTDSGGQKHQGEEWVVDMVKTLPSG